MLAPRILNLADEYGGSGDPLAIACDPLAPVSALRLWLVGRENPWTGEVIQWARPAYWRKCPPGWYRWIPTDDPDYTCFLWPAKGRARGAFFVRYFEVDYLAPSFLTETAIHDLDQDIR